MRKDLFIISPLSVYGTSLSEGYDGIETYLDLEYDGEMPAEVREPLVRKTPVALSTRVLSSIIVAASLVITACSVRPREYGPLPEVTPTQTLGTWDDVTIANERVVYLKEDLSNIDEFKQALNKRRVIIKVPPNLEKDLSIVRRFGETKPYSDKSANSKKLVGNQGTFVDDIILDSSFVNIQDYHYNLVSGGKIVKSLEADFQPDWLIQGETKLSSFVWRVRPSFEIVVFDKDASLLIEDRTLEIKAGQILSLGASISTYTEVEAQTPAAPDTKGKNGGIVFIRTKFFRGDLEFNFLGTQGGPGLVGDGGTGGNSGYLDFVAEHSENFRINISRMYGFGGDIGNVHFDMGKDGEIQQSTVIINGEKI